MLVDTMPKLVQTRPNKVDPTPQTRRNERDRKDHKPDRLDRVAQYLFAHRHHGLLRARRQHTAEDRNGEALTSLLMQQQKKRLEPVVEQIRHGIVAPQRQRAAMALAVSELHARDALQVASVTCDERGARHVAQGSFRKLGGTHRMHTEIDRIFRPNLDRLGPN